jgi:hypothetical protein
MKSQTNPSRQEIHQSAQDNLDQHLKPQAGFRRKDHYRVFISNHQTPDGIEDNPETRSEHQKRKNLQRQAGPSNQQDKYSDRTSLKHETPRQNTVIIRPGYSHVIQRRSDEEEENPEKPEVQLAHPPNLTHGAFADNAPMAHFQISENLSNL